MSEELKMVPMIQPNKLFVTENRDHTLFEYYFVGYIGDPEEYIELCNALRAARPEDKFVLRFNSGGGQVRTGNQILNAIYECEATTIGFIENDCGSMTTFLFLACDTWGVSKYAEWFSHTISGGNYGKESETWEASQFLRRQTHKRIREEYNNFLTSDEIDKVIAGGDVYLDSDEIMERLQGFDEARAAQGCGNPECDSCGVDGEEESFDLQDMIKEAVTEAVSDLRKDFDIVPKQKPTPKRKSRAKPPEKVVD